MEVVPYRLGVIWNKSVDKTYLTNGILDKFKDIEYKYLKLAYSSYEILEN